MFATHAGAQMPHQTDPFGPLVRTLLHFEQPNGSTTITDDGLAPGAWVLHREFGDLTTISTSEPLMESASLLFHAYQADGSFSHAVISTPGRSEYAAAGDFCVEFKWDGMGRSILSSSSPGFFVSCISDDSPALAGEWAIRRLSDNGAKLRFEVKASDGTLRFAQCNQPGSIGPHWIRCNRVDGILRIFVDGILSAVQDISQPANNTTLSGSAILTIGGRQDGGHPLPNDYCPCKYDEFRFTVGAGRGITNYTPSTTAFPNP